MRSAAPVRHRVAQAGIATIAHLPLEVPPQDASEGVQHRHRVEVGQRIHDGRSEPPPASARSVPPVTATSHTGKIDFGRQEAVI